MAGLLSKYIMPGCRVDLQGIDRTKPSHNDLETHNKTYQSQVLDILGDDRIEIAMPQEKSKLILLSVDGEYDLYFYGDNMLYQCYARVADRYKDNNRYILVMDLISNLRRYQRREYYRFSCALEMKSRPLEKEEAEEKVEDKLATDLPLKGSIIVDISGGGLRFVADYAYEEQSLILCKYRLLLNGRSKEYSLIGRVLSVRELENRRGVFEHRGQYINVDAGEREEIIKYIFDEERKTIKNKREHSDLLKNEE